VLSFGRVSGGRVLAVWCCIMGGGCYVQEGGVLPAPEGEWGGSGRWMPVLEGVRRVAECGCGALGSRLSLREVGAKSWKVGAGIWTVNGGCGGESRLWKATGEFCVVSAGLWRGTVVSSGGLVPTCGELVP
jgi:hypothetical protein